MKNDAFYKLPAADDRTIEIAGFYVIEHAEIVLGNQVELYSAGGGVGVLEMPYPGYWFNGQWVALPYDEPRNYATVSGITAEN